MKHLGKHYLLPALALLAFGVVLGANLDAYVSDDDAIQQLKKIQRAFVIIQRQYVEPVETSDVAEEGIRGMLKELDPHSSYIPAEDVKQVRENYRGSFGGVGIFFDVVRDTAQVISPIADGPSEKVGVMSGDRIVRIEDSSAVELSEQAIQKRLKGPVGSNVQMTVYRPGTGKNYTFTIERGEIPLRSINSAYMVDDQTGYVRIERFAMTTHDEFMEEMRALKKKGMQRLVLDLRSNPGGVMKSAIKIADEFLGEGMTIVQTKGRDQSMNNSYRATSGGSFENQPVVVLVNGHSASASEILTGALQDHDRALIVGRRTFGKALVQKQFDLSDGSLLQMTVGRYYTPVGRLIQTPYQNGDRHEYIEQKRTASRTATYNPSEYKESIPDSLTYQTDHGRAVFGGGGILPDYIVQPDTTSIEWLVQNSGVDGSFVINWFPNNETRLRASWREREDAFVEQYTVPDSTVDAFWDYAVDKGLTLTSDTAKVNPAKGVFLRSEAEEAHDFISMRLKGVIAGRLYSSGARWPIYNAIDPTFQKAVSLWGEASELSAYHAEAGSISTGRDAKIGGDRN
jgi:carboxyl-terminal processing protease